MATAAAAATTTFPWTRRPLTTSTTTTSFSRRRCISFGHHQNHVRISTASYPYWSTNVRTRTMTSSSAAAEDTLIPPQEEEVEAEATAAEQPAVSVPVSPSDVLTMFFQAEGTMSEATIPTVLKALEETEGISNLTVKVLEGIASVELKKQTTVQATGVASSLVEIIQGSGFKLQTLNLSFEDESLD